METFLKQIAEHLIAEFKDELSELTVVLPNKRATLFLKQHLSQLIDKANITKISQTKKFIFTFLEKSYRQKKVPTFLGWD